MTQPAVSHKLRRLERRIGRVLLRRGEGGMAPTTDGEQLLRYADRLVDLHDEAVAALACQELAGDLRLGMTEDMTGSGIARILARFSTVHPNVSLVSRVAHSWTLLEWLERGELDMALVQLYEDRIQPTDQVLWRDDLVWIQSPDFDAADVDPLPFIAFDPRCFYRSWAIDAMSARGRQLRVVLECPSVEGVSSAVLSGLGIALVNRRNVRGGLVEASLGLPSTPTVGYVARLASGKPSQPAIALLAAIEDELAEKSG